MRTATFYHWRSKFGGMGGVFACSMCLMTTTAKAAGSTSISRCRPSGCFARWIASSPGLRLACIQPGTPHKNAYIERLTRTVRYDWLAQ